MLSIITFSNLYFTLVILIEFFEEEEIQGYTHQIRRDYILPNVNCVYDGITYRQLFSSQKTDKI